jgi:hypothetical protein
MNMAPSPNTPLLPLSNFNQLITYTAILNILVTFVDDSPSNYTVKKVSDFPVSRWVSLTGQGEFGK